MVHVALALLLLNTEAAGNPIAATLIIDNTGDPSNFGGSSSTTSCSGYKPIYGDLLLAALEVNPTLTLIINTIPSADAVQTFSNLVRGNFVVVTPDQVDSQHAFIVTPTAQFDFTTAGWQAGDFLLFMIAMALMQYQTWLCSTTYFAIVYRPGFSENGVIMNNEVDNCTISGYQDNSIPNTSSAWVNNFAFNNGSPATIDPLPILTMKSYGQVLRRCMQVIWLNIQQEVLTAYNFSLIP